MFREQPMTDEETGHMTSHRLQNRRDAASPLVISAKPQGGHGRSLSSHNSWHEWNFNMSYDICGEMKFNLKNTN